MIDEVLDEAEKCREKEKQDHVMKIDDTKFIFILFFVIVLVALICK